MINRCSAISKQPYHVTQTSPLSCLHLLIINNVPVSADNSILEHIRTYNKTVPYWYRIGLFVCIVLTYLLAEFQRELQGVSNFPFLFPSKNIQRGSYCSLLTMITTLMITM